MLSIEGALTLTFPQALGLRRNPRPGLSSLSPNVRRSKIGPLLPIHSTAALQPTRRTCSSRAQEHGKGP